MKEILSISDYLRINTDSRTIRRGDIYLPLIGAQFNGHDFIQDALLKRASLAYSAIDIDQLKLTPELSDKVVRVEDTLLQYQRLANEYRNLVNPIVIGITGSSGKTTVKEILRIVLAEKYRIHYTQANLNNEIGVPKTILSMPADTEVLILEMGMRALGEIELLSKIAEPNIAIITNIGTAHIERLGSVENIRRAKLEITKGIRRQGLGVRGTLIVDSDLYKKIENNYKHLNLIEFSPTPNTQYLTPENNCLLSDGLIADINAIYKVANLLGLSDEQIKVGLSKYSPGPGRGNFIYKSNGDILIDETYNANPESIRNSVRAMLKQFPDDLKIAVLGDVLESQDDLIGELFREIGSCQNDKFRLIDGRGREIQDIMDELTAIRALGRKVVLVKASRGAKFERVLDGYISHDE